MTDHFSVQVLLHMLYQADVRERIRLVRQYPLIALASENELNEAALNLAAADEVEQYLRGDTKPLDSPDFAPPPVRVLSSIRQTDPNVEALFDEE